MASTNGKSTTNKSYKLGFSVGKQDAESGQPRRLTFSELMEARERGEEVEYRPIPQPRGIYGSDVQRGYQDAYKKYAPRPTVRAACEAPCGNAALDRADKKRQG
jgi:hypothetical protein